MLGPVMAPLQETYGGLAHTFSPGFLQSQLAVTPGQNYLFMLGSTEAEPGWEPHKRGLAMSLASTLPALKLKN